MSIITVAMIPFFLAINCLMGVRTLNFSALNSMNYNLSLTPIVTALLIIPMIYMFFYYLYNNKRGYNKTNFIGFVIGEVIWIIILNLIQGYFKDITLVHIHGYAILAMGSVVIALLYIIRLNNFMKDRLSVSK